MAEVRKTPRVTKESLLERWCIDRQLFSKADLMLYGCENYYLRAWRTVCDWVTEGRVKRLSEKECEARNLTTSMAWYQWGNEPADTELESATRHNNFIQEQAINFKAIGKQLAFI